jgi:hypothetical protein
LAFDSDIPALYSPEWMLFRLLLGCGLLAAAVACGGEPVRWQEDDDGGPGAGGAEGAEGGAGGGAGEDTAPVEPPFEDTPIECDPGCEGPAAGVDLGCGPRFMYGINYAWLKFGSDFGGNLGYQQGGVVEHAAEHAANLTLMRDHEIRFVRWWLFPDFRGDGVIFSADDEPLGLFRTTIPDILKALELAARTDVHLMLTLFSFDGFRPSGTQGGHWTPSLQPIVLDAELRASLLENVVRPIAAAVEASPYRDRMPAWDVINEPEWAMHGTNDLGDEPYTPTDGLASVTHDEMELFLSEVIGVLREESSAQVTVGGSAMKWRNAWTRLDLDFYQFHIYDWVNRWWPYDQSPDDYGVGDKPVVMGEFPPHGLSSGAIPYSAMVESWHDNGYAGALSWDFNGLVDPNDGDVDFDTLEQIRLVGEGLGCGIEPRR